MKRNILYIILFAGILFTGGCNDDFLNESPGEIMMLEGTVLISSRDTAPSILLNLPDAGSADYYITVFPKWMVFDSMHGRFENGTATLQFKVVEPEWRANPDYLSGTVVLNINGSGIIGFEAVCANIGNIPGQLSPDIMGIEGSVVDAVTLKPKNLVVIATRNPNRLLVLNTVTELTKIVPLDKSPQCIDFTDNGNAMLVGYETPEIVKIDLNSGSVLKTYPLDCIPSDLAAFDNGWCYISPRSNNWEKLVNLNLATGYVFTNQEPWTNPMHGSALLKKAAGKPLLMATRPNLGPTGVLRFDISRGIASDTITYWHENVIDFWISDDGAIMITKEGTIHPVPEYIPTNNYFLELPESGKLNLPWNSIDAADFCTARNSMFVALGSNWQPGWPQEQNSAIMQYAIGNQNLLNTYNPSFTALIQGNTLVLAYNHVHFLFSDQAGTKLFGIRRTAPSTGVEQWSIEKFVISIF